MRTVTGLMLIAIGAILAFAVRGHPSWLNIQVVGWVIILTGVVGIIIPRRGAGWLRRRMVLRRGPRGPVVKRVEETRYPPYVIVNPDATTADEAVADAGEPAAAQSAAAAESLGDEDGDEDMAPARDPEREAADRAAAEQQAVEQAAADWAAADRAAAAGGPEPTEEVVEQYIEE